jgi:diaminopimelate epimerase
MGVARLNGPDDLKVTIGDRAWTAVAVDMGNPHAVVLVDDLAEAGDLSLPPIVDPAFSDGVNVEFVTRVGDAHVAMRVHERGVGETRSCGTGACAAMVVAARKARAAAPTSYVVDVPGGRLTVTLREDGHVELTGPAVLVGSGVLDETFVA